MCIFAHHTFHCDYIGLYICPRSNILLTYFELIKKLSVKLEQVRYTMTASEGIQRSVRTYVRRTCVHVHMLSSL